MFKKNNPNTMNPLSQKMANSFLKNAGMPDMSALTQQQLYNSQQQTEEIMKAYGQNMQNQAFQNRTLYRATIVDIQDIETPQNMASKSAIATMTFELNGTMMTEKGYALIAPGEAFGPGKIVMVSYDPNYQDPGGYGVKLAIVNKNP
ncbi:MAG: hypothetical protein FWG14_01645 [Peptococcaceae bacterium]|nr:hypothetical protein [Peptococcaceae bacterium]